MTPRPTQRLSDAAKTSRIAALLAEQFPAPRYAPLWECAASTGWTRRARYADLLVLHLWPSDGLELHGFEIKASRSDLTRELDDPEKSHALARYCHRWTLVTWDTAVVGTLTLPDGWGWWSVQPDCEGFDRHRRAVTRTPEPWPAAFAAAMVRRAIEQAPNADFTAAAVRRAVAIERAEGERWRLSATRDAHRRGWAQGRGLDDMPVEWGPGAKQLWDEWRAAWEIHSRLTGAA